MFKCTDVMGNQLWAITSQLAWNQLRDNIVQQHVQFITENKEVIADTKWFNGSPYSKEDVDEESLYVNSGYGPQSVALINRQWKQKFPKATFADLSAQGVSEVDITVFAYLDKNLEYKQKFNKSSLYFNNSCLVKAFEAKDMLQKFQIHPITYQNSDRFMVMLDTKEQDDVIYLAKGYEMYQMVTPFAVLPTQQQKIDFINSSDSFIMPCIELDEQLDSLKIFRYQTIKNSTVLAGSTITDTLEKVKFKMDEVGASVQAMATIFITGSCIYVEPKARHFIFDKPYYIIMAKRNSTNPYFWIKVNNTEFMTKEV